MIELAILTTTMLSLLNDGDMKRALNHHEDDDYDDSLSAMMSTKTEEEEKNSENDEGTTNYFRLSDCYYCKSCCKCDSNG